MSRASELCRRRTLSRCPHQAMLPAVMMEHEPDLEHLTARLYSHACKGTPLDLLSTSEAENDSACGAMWPKDRTVPASVILEVATRAREPGSRVRTLNVRGAKITGSLDLEGALLPCPLILEGCYLTERVVLRQSEIVSLRLARSTLEQELDGREMIIRASVDMNHGFTAQDRVSIDAAKVRTWLDCTGGRFNGREGIAFSANGIDVAADMICGVGGMASEDRRIAVFGHQETAVDDERFIANGEVRLARAHIGGQLYLTGGHFKHAHKMALFADGIKVDGRIMFGPGFLAEGQMYLRRAEVGGQLRFEGSAVSPPNPETMPDERTLETQAPEISLHLEAANITRALVIKPEKPIEGVLNLINANVGYLNDLEREKSWPYKRYALYGLRFGQLGGPKEQRPDGSWREERTYPTRIGRDEAVLERRDWLRGDRDGFHPQLYDQLAENYARIGHEASRRSILISKQWDRRRSLSVRNSWLNAPQAALDLVSWALIGYGYRPHRVFYWFLILFGIGCGYFAYEGHHAVKPHDPMQYGPRYSPAIYTLDLLLPVINLGQREYWIAKPGFPQDLSTALIIAGWLLATVFLAGISGLVRRYNE